MAADEVPGEETGAGSPAAAGENPKKKGGDSHGSEEAATGARAPGHRSWLWALLCLLILGTVAAALALLLPTPEPEMEMVLYGPPPITPADLQPRPPYGPLPPRGP